jgi:hypothetical protein
MINRERTRPLLRIGYGGTLFIECHMEMEVSTFLRGSLF